MADDDREAVLRGVRTAVRDERVLAAMAAVPRENFVPVPLRDRAWEDGALPIGGGQTISQPLVVARMCELLELRGGEHVLDVGTGSGYHAAVLARLAHRVVSIERDPELSRTAAAALAGTGVELVVGDGWLGHPAAAPYDAINVAADPGTLPGALVEQLAPGGRLVVPVAGRLLCLRRGANGTIVRAEHEEVRFVPLVHT